MRRVKYMRAWADHTWDTVIVDVPSIEEDPENGVDYDNLCDSDIEHELFNYASCVLAAQEKHKGVALFAVYNNNC